MTDDFNSNGDLHHFAPIATGWPIPGVQLQEEEEEEGDLKGWDISSGGKYSDSWTPTIARVPLTVNVENDNERDSVTDYGSDPYNWREYWDIPPSLSKPKPFDFNPKFEPAIGQENLGIEVDNPPYISKPKPFDLYPKLKPGNALDFDPQIQEARLVEACKMGDIVAVRIIVESLSFVDIESEAIIEAAKVGNAEIVQYLLMDTNIDPTLYHNHALRAAAYRGNTNVIKVLLEGKPNLFYYR